MNKFFLILLLALPNTALAWNQTMTCGGFGNTCSEGQMPLPTYWTSPCIGFHLNESGTNQMNFSDVETVVQKSILTWVQPNVSVLSPYYSGRTNEDRIGYNPYIQENTNIIVFRDDDSWTESHAMMALTTVTHRNSTGVIYDADIEINTSDYQYGIVEINGSDVVDLQNTLTHEIGHVFGLSHSDVTYATMFPYASTGETNLRTLSDDDLIGISVIHPIDITQTKQCEYKKYYFEKPPYAMDEAPPSSSGCSIQARKTNSISLSIFTAFGLLFIAMRKRKRE